MIASLRAYNRSGARLGVLPWTELSRTIVRNAPGALNAQVPLSLIGSAMLGEEVYLRVAEDGVEADDWYVLDDDGDDPTDEGGKARALSIGAKGALTVLDWAEVYPDQHVPGGPLLGLRPTHELNTSPGGIMATLIDRAKARGAIPHVTYSFTATHDSAGTPWPSNYARVYDSGTSLLKVLTGFAEDAWADFEMTGFQLDLYVADTALAEDHPDRVLRLGKGVTQAPRKRARAGVRSTMLAVGNEGAIVEVTDADAVAKYGRREGYEGRGSITDVGTLTAATQVSLGRRTAASESFTLGVEPGEAPPIPRPGNYVRYDQRRLSPTELEPMRVQSVAWQYGENLLLSVELADLWTDRDVALARRVDTILNGSTANERAPQQPLGDEKPPSTPEGLALVSSPYEDPTTGAQYAQVSATWLPVTTDVDGTPVGELKGYAIEWKQPELVRTDVPYTPYREDAGAGATLKTWSPVVPGTPVQARIAAYDRWDNFSDWSDWVEIMAGVDETAPSRPTGVSAGNYQGLFRSGWDGSFAGGPRPADLSYVEVHLSPIDGFVPDEDDLDATLVGTLFAPGYVYTDKDRAPYGETRYMRMVAVDTSGNRSAPSVQVSAATGQVVSEDLFDGIINDSRLLGDVAIIRTAHIDELNLNSANVSTIEVGKVSAGVINAQWVMAGTISTGTRGTPQVPTVPVVELNGLGIYRFDSTGNVTVAINNEGALITGQYRTATTGRRIEMGAAGTAGELRFVSPGGVVSHIRSYTPITGDVGVEAIDIGMDIPGTFRGWNHLQMSADQESYLLSDYVTVMFGGSPDSLGQFSVDFADDKGRPNVADTSGNPTRSYRYTITRNEHLWRVGNDATNKSAMKLTGGGNLDSPQLQFFPGDYTKNGVAFRVRVRTSDNIPLMQLVYPNTDAFAYGQAAAWDTMSDVALKDDIRALDVDEITEITDRLLAAPVQRYRYRGSESGREHVGLLAHQAPRQMVSGAPGHQAIDGYQFTALVLLLAQQMEARLRKVEERVSA